MTDMTDMTGLELPGRTSKPRATGLTMVIDNGLPTGVFIDAVTSNAHLIDVVKFGWGTAMVTRDLERKIAAVHDNGIRFSFGGTLFEKFASQGRLRAYLDMCHRYGADLNGPEIARQLTVSLNPVRTHQKNIYAKLGVNNRRAAVRRAVELKLLSRRP